MAIRVLLDHGIQEDHLIFVTFLVARGGGITMLRRAFPHVKVVCGAVDDGLRETWLDDYDSEGPSATAGRKCWVVEPGMGQIGKISFHRHALLQTQCKFRPQVIVITYRVPLRLASSGGNMICSGVIA
jgi:Uracil phosphoribosyltransferase